jgi:hypothetical protein
LSSQSPKQLAAFIDQTKTNTIMCGITVSIALQRDRRPSTPEERADLESRLSKSLDLIAHRGPDAKGIWINDDGSVGTLAAHHSPTSTALPL